MGLGGGYGYTGAAVLGYAGYKAAAKIAKWYNGVKAKGLSHPRSGTVPNDDTRSRIRLSRNLKYILRTRDMEVAVQPRGRHAFDHPLHDKRDRLHKLVEPAKIVKFTGTRTQLTCDSGSQAVYSYGLFSTTQVGELRTGLVNMAMVDGTRDNMPAQNGGTWSTNANASGTDNQMTVRIPIWEYKYTFKNTANMRARIKIFEFMAKVDSDTDPATAWGDNFTLVNELASSAQRTTFDTAMSEVTSTTTVGVTTIGQIPYGKGLKKYWHLVGQVQYDIDPGRAISYMTCAAKNKVSAWDINNAAGSFMQGWTKYLVVIIHGSLVSEQLTGTNTGIMSYSNAAFDVMAEWKMIGWGAGNCQVQRLLAANYTLTADEDMPDIAPADQIQINPETDAGTAGFDGAYV